jgi:hypothetical protein
MASTNISDVQNMALFCDFENVALGVRDAKYAEFDIRKVLERLLVKGDIVVKKAYCDWERYKDFKKSMHEARIPPTSAWWSMRSTFATPSRTWMRLSSSAATRISRRW